MTISVVLITLNEAANIGPTLESVQPLMQNPGGEMIVVDSESTDDTIAIAQRAGAKVCSEPWKGFAAQKNSALDKASGDWILLLDADERVPPPLCDEIRQAMSRSAADLTGYFIPRRNYYFGRWIRHGGFWPDRKLRLFRRGHGRVADRPVHEDVETSGQTGRLRNGLDHHGYPTVGGYADKINVYSTLKAGLLLRKGYRGFSFLYIVVAPICQFLYNYFLRGGFLDGTQGFLVHFGQSVYISLSFAKVWEATRKDR